MLFLFFLIQQRPIKHLLCTRPFFLVPGNTVVNKIEMSLFLSTLYDSRSTFSFIAVFCSVYKYFQ